MLKSEVSFADLPLRERKAASTRLALLDAMLEKLRNMPFEEITVRSLCERVGISEPTFFNYFGPKHHLLGFFVQLWSIEIAWRMARATSGRRAVADLFLHTARSMAAHDRIMPEIIAWQIRAHDAPDLAPPTRAELLARFPRCPGITEQKPQPVNRLIAAGLEEALADGSLPRRSNLARLTTSLTSLFFGAPSWLRSAKEVEKAYRDGIAAVWPKTTTRTGKLP